MLDKNSPQYQEASKKAYGFCGLCGHPIISQEEELMNGCLYCAGIAVEYIPHVEEESSKS